MQQCLMHIKKKRQWAGNVLRNKACSAKKAAKNVKTITPCKEQLDLVFSIVQ